jgi:anti-sigma B factor antagonist
MKTFQHSETPNVYLLALNQPLTGLHADEVREKFTEIAANGGKRVVLNMAQVSFMDTRGLAALIAGLRLFGNRADGVQLVAPQTQPSLLFELTGFDKIFHITPNLAV